jgi:uncharacterized protein (TIGR01777 family)
VRVVVGGASGYVGTALATSLRADGHEVVVLSRRPAASAGLDAVVPWSEVERAVEGADAVVNLAGESIGTPRWTASRKRAIRASRVDTNRAVAAAVAAAAAPPGVFVTASGIDYYGDSGEETVDESSPPGSSFLASVCAAWEAAAAGAPVRQVAVRTALVVGPAAPALRMLALPFRLFVGGRLGNGRQFFPWIGLDDLVGVYRQALESPALSGPVNAVAPEQLRQRDAARLLGSALHRPALLPTPAPVLRLALGEQADLLLHGQRAVSRRLDGFGFTQPELRGALAAALRA